jgi:hypothetical protein
LIDRQGRAARDPADLRGMREDRDRMSAEKQNFVGFLA